MKRNIINVALKNTRIYLILLIVLSIGISYLTFSIAIYIKYAIDGILFSNYDEIPRYLDQIFKHNCIDDLSIIALIILSLNAGEKLLKYFRDRFTTKFKLKIITNLKLTLFKHVLNLEYESYNSYDKAEIMQRINEDAEVYSKFFNSLFNVILDIIFLSIFIGIEGITLNLTISAYIFFTIVIMMLFSLWYFKKLDISLENMITKRKDLLKTIINNINNFKFIRMFNKQKEEKQNYKKINEACCDAEINFIKLVLFYDITIEHLTYFKTPIIYMIGGIAIIKRKNGNWIISSLTYTCGKNI